MEDLRELGQSVHTAQMEIGLAKTAIKEVLEERPVDQDRLAVERERLAHARTEDRTYLSALERAKRAQAGRQMVLASGPWHAG